MKTLTKAVLGCAGVLGAWSLLLRPRQGQPGWEELEGVRFAHRASTTPAWASRRTPWRPSAGRWSTASARSWMYI